MLAWNSFVPTVFPLLRDRRLALILLGVVTLLVALLALGLPGWPCPVLQGLGIPCPGCGLTRATLLLLRGDVRTSLTYHAFAPVFLLGLSLMGAAALLPERPRRPFVEGLITFERRTGIVFILLIALIFYWLARLLFMNSSFVQLIRG
jgi:hypothetical protein